MKACLLVLLVLLVSVVPARAASVLFDTTNGTVADANGWTSTLYVNGTAFPLVHTCALVAAVVTCTATLPNISAALVAGSTQTFEIDLFDSVLNVRSVKSLPFIRNRPGAPTSGRFQ